jgi:outer membrane protein OmpA-like peptidoglycan-associated protein
MCPEQSGPPENRGCPDGDRDGDGVVDRIDNCPDEVGRAEFQGCRTKQLISITASQLKVFQNVQFATGKATISPRSRRLLENVAQVIKAHPEFRKIRIEGHTDDRGADDFNKSLSQDRAASVRDALIGQGVEADRLEAIGFGEERPLSSNRSANGRRKNRRVEFNLEDIGPPSGPAKGAPAPSSAPAPASKPAQPAPAAKPAPAPAKPSGGAR